MSYINSSINDGERARENNVLAGILNASLDPLFQVNERGIIQLVNEAATQQFGWTRNEFLGNNISMICGGTHARHHDAYMKRYLQTGQARVMGTKRELTARRKDGSEFTIQLSLVEVDVPEGEERLFCGFVLDLTEQKQHVYEIASREAFTNKIIEGSYDALLVTDKDGNITRVNDTAVRQFESSALCGMSIHSLLETSHAEWLKGEMHQYLAAGIAISTQKQVGAVRPESEEMFPALIGVSGLEGPDDGEPFFAIYLHDLSERKRMMQAEAEKSAAEYLLFNMLPEKIAGRLKNDPSHIAESHNFAAVLFADIVGFTSMSSMMEPHEVVSMLNELFSMFDEVVDEYGLNKIKTIGDCYMVTSVPGIDANDEEEHCRRICHFGLDMIHALQQYNTGDRDKTLNLRVGINCGPVVAGVVGTKRFLYDLWGDAVNLASRMESTGVPGKIQTTSYVAELMKDDFCFEKRGIVDVKGKGEMETHFLTGKKKFFQRPETPPNTSNKPPARGRAALMDMKSDSELLKSVRALEVILSERIIEKGENDS